MSARFSGLTSVEAQARLRSEGPNELPRASKRTVGRILGDVIREPMFAMLLVGAGIYFALGSPQEAIILFFFATFSVSIAVVQDFRSEKVLEALRTLASPRALVIRDGRQERIPGREVVRGDLMIVTEGDRIAADAVVRDTADLRVDESALTGESVPVHKTVTDVGFPPEQRPGGDSSPFVFSGTLVVGGHGLVEVLATGGKSQIGAIGASLEAIKLDKPRTQVEMKRLVRIWATAGLGASVMAVLLYGLVRGEWLEGFLAGIALGMSMLPEEFPLVLAVFMVMGAWRISKARVLTRRASAIEYLGAATVLCTDKTGTLTKNQMQVEAVASGIGVRWLKTDTDLGDGTLEVIRFGVLATPKVTLDPMERAIQAELPTAYDDSGDIIHAYPLRPSLMAMSQVWQGQTGNMIVAAKGATEAILKLCGADEQTAAGIRRQADALAREGMRVLGVAKAEIDAKAMLPKDHVGIRFTFLGLIGLSDPLRDEVPEAIRECLHAGIRVIMVTGDYPATAMAIAERAGLTTGKFLSGADLERLDDDALKIALKDAIVCARITPLQKLRIVKALKDNGEVVAMTGDGVNDAPSLKAADIGIAMGGRGTDVAREAASIVLLDDDFTSIVRTIRLGRRIYDNLRKAISFVMAVHILIGGLALIPLIIGLPILFFPVHIAFLEMIIDPICSLAFEAEREESDVMKRPPRPVDQRLFTPGMIWWALFQGFTALACVVTVYLASLASGMSAEDVRGRTFVTLVAVNGSLTLINRSFHRRSFVQMLLRDNRVLWIVAGLMLCALTAVVGIRPLRNLFHFGDIGLMDLTAAFAAAGVALLVLNTAKYLAPLARLTAARVSTGAK